MEKSSRKSDSGRQTSTLRRLLSFRGGGSRLDSLDDTSVAAASAKRQIHAPGSASSVNHSELSRCFGSSQEKKTRPRLAGSLMQRHRELSHLRSLVCFLARQRHALFKKSCVCSPSPVPFVLLPRSSHLLSWMTPLYPHLCPNDSDSGKATRSSPQPLASQRPSTKLL